jgi:hypothetical protein
MAMSNQVLTKCIIERFHKGVLEHVFISHKLCDSVGSCAVLLYYAVIALLLVLFQ